MLIRLAWMLAPYALVSFGALGVISGVSVVFRPHETTPTEVRAETLASVQPDHEYLRVIDGGLYWPEVARYFRNGGRAGAGSEKILGYCVPIVGSREVDGWRQATASGVKRPGAARLTLLWFEPDDLARAFPDAARGAPSTDFERAEFTGTVDESPPKELTEYVRNAFACTPDSVTVIRFHGVPPTVGDGFGMVATGILIGLGGFFWVRRRRRWRAAVVPKHGYVPGPVPPIAAFAGRPAAADPWRGI